MLNYAVTFFVITLLASLLGFGGVAGLSAGIGWTFAGLALAYLVIAVVSVRGDRTLRVP